ncbi:hypothetical protein RS030_6893 [Cryptosporidium xiaoi]|uniref:Uncharacterized protein n=1 Tax=Cryptosporidium xiaoi TaxID=659607 RepID=A0AAV9XW68_9CRYT
MYTNNTDNLGVTFHKIKVLATTNHVNFHLNILKFEGRINKITTNWEVKVQKKREYSQI